MNCLFALQLLKRPVSGVRRMAAHPVLPYCKYFSDALNDLSVIHKYVLCDIFHTPMAV